MCFTYKMSHLQMQREKSHTYFKTTCQIRSTQHIQYIISPIWAIIKCKFAFRCLFSPLKRQISKHLTPIRYQLTTEPKTVAAAAVGEDWVGVNSWLEACICGYTPTNINLPPTNKTMHMHVQSTGIQRPIQKLACVHERTHTTCAQVVRL